MTRTPLTLQFPPEKRPQGAALQGQHRGSRGPSRCPREAAAQPAARSAPLCTAACRDKERPRSRRHSQRARIWISRARARHTAAGSGRARPGEPAGLRRRRRAQPGPLQSCARRGRSAGSAGAFSRAALSWP